MHNDVLVTVQGSLGRITLNRPSKLNALTPQMIRDITHALIEWEQMETVSSVLIDAVEGRAFCAGGDIESTYRWTFGEQATAYEYWYAEHTLVLLIWSYSKPVLTVLDGLTLGGGVGLACHASQRLVTRNARLGMPEVAIGLAPDVGGLYILGRARGRMGFFLALTAQYVGPFGALQYGLADHLMDQHLKAQLVDALADGEGPAKAVQAVAATAPAGNDESADFCDAQALIGECFDKPRIEDVLAALDSNPGLIAERTAKRIRAMSPIAVKVTFRGLTRAANGASLPDTLVADLRRNVHFSYGPDLREGIRAAVIDKDRRPVWSPKTLAQVNDQMVEGYSAPLEAPDLDIKGILARTNLSV